MLIVGYLLIAIAAGWLVYKLYVSYKSAGGTDFHVPVYDAAIYPPPLAVLGLFWVLRDYQVHWPFWIYLGLGLGLAALAAAAIKVCEEMGDRPLS